ncbi:carbohydrate ABC transporter permease [Myceligenerans indicum]|uniref:Carbohydrate ABC transporter permease n=1 Tax=Myceligenerans indicum TaxID=2593663 RepID=A0ABS1LG66_9MICO|nr:carbohydrate ABC transporter permease [Myceligenerans indicum]MBL0885222.1 carbohydrate ABC transporter permease [Myceligenerans indicum]
MSAPAPTSVDLVRTTATAPAPTPAGPPPRIPRFLRRLPVRVLVAVLLVIEIYPLVWLVLGSFKTQNEFLTEPSWALPSRITFDNYVVAWTEGDVSSYIRNSLLATAPALAFIIVFGVAAGFALEVLVWRGRNKVLLAFLVGIMVPGQMILLPLFTAYFKVGLAGTLWPLIITYTAIGLPLTVFMMATYFRAVPREVFEAAALDGASVLRSFWTIGFPMVRNAVLTVALVQFFFIWNDLLIALTFITGRDLRTIQVGLLTFSGEFGQTAYGPLFAAICINVFGTLLLYLFLNQQVMKGLTAGSVKG